MHGSLLHCGIMRMSTAQVHLVQNSMPFVLNNLKDDHAKNTH
jgi:hypothetical protein